MSWRSELLGASFREVPFKVDGVDTGVGRRTVLHQYPFREVPFAEDLGADADEYRINGYVVQHAGNNYDYFKERNALIAALKTEGSGKLVHPFLGEKTVNLSGKARITETFRQGGIARFTMTFVEAGKRIHPKSSLDPTQAMDNSVVAGAKYMTDEFARFYEVASESVDNVVEDITSSINMMKNTMRGIRGGITSVVSKVLGIIDTALTDLTGIVYSACSIPGFLSDSLGNFLRVVGEPDPFTSGMLLRCTNEYRKDAVYMDGSSVPQVLGTSLVNAFVEVARFGEATGGDSPSPYGGMLDVITVSSQSKARQSLNRLYTVNTVRNLALMNATRIAARISYQSYEEATDVLDTVVDAIEEQLTKMGDEVALTTYSDYDLVLDNSASYAIMEDLRATFVQVMRDIGTDLAKIIDYTLPPVTVTTLQLAYDQYNDIDRENEIFERNQPTVQHPGQLPSSLTIKMLSK